MADYCVVDSAQMHRALLSALTVEQGVASPALQHSSELPTDIDRVADAESHPDRLGSCATVTLRALLAKTRHSTNGVCCARKMYPSQSVVL